MSLSLFLDELQGMMTWKITVATEVMWYTVAAETLCHVKQSAQCKFKPARFTKTVFNKTEGNRKYKVFFLSQWGEAAHQFYWAWGFSRGIIESTVWNPWCQSFTSATMYFPICISSMFYRELLFIKLWSPKSLWRLVKALGWTA